MLAPSRFREGYLSGALRSEQETEACKFLVTPLQLS
jgi:hypothetical protein